MLSCDSSRVGLHMASRTRSAMERLPRSCHHKDPSCSARCGCVPACTPACLCTSASTRGCNSYMFPRSPLFLVPPPQELRGLAEDETSSVSQLREAIHAHVAAVDAYAQSRDPPRTAEDFSCHLHFQTLGDFRKTLAERGLLLQGHGNLDTPSAMQEVLVDERSWMTGELSASPTYWVSDVQAEALTGTPTEAKTGVSRRPGERVYMRGHCCMLLTMTPLPFLMPRIPLPSLLQFTLFPQACRASAGSGRPHNRCPCSAGATPSRPRDCSTPRCSRCAGHSNGACCPVPLFCGDLCAQCIALRATFRSSR